MIHELIGSFEKPQQADLNNVQLINTLQQRNLYNEISILKERLHEETTKLKKISDERDSYRTALQVLTKELHVDEPVAPTHCPTMSSNYAHAESREINFAEAVERPTLNSRQTRQKIPVIPTQNRFQLLRDQNTPPQNNAATASSNNARTKSTTVLIGDSMVKNIHGNLAKKWVIEWSLNLSPGPHVAIWSII